MAIETEVARLDRPSATAYTEANGRRHSRFKLHVDSGDRHRDARRWSDGFVAYRSGLDILPLHSGYLVQAGHCLKEIGRLAAAECYYRSALILGAPLGDVEEHLVYVAVRSSYFEDASKLRAIAAAARAKSAEIDQRPTLDELTALAAVLGFAHRIKLSAVLDLMRRGVTQVDATCQLIQQNCPTGAIAGPIRIGAGETTITREFALRLGEDRSNESLRFQTQSSTIQAPPPMARMPAAPVLEVGNDPLLRARTSVADIMELAGAFSANRHEPTESAFFGAAPQRDDSNNVSLQPDARPLVSILILTHNGSHVALLSAGSVMAAGAGIPYEILIIDNGSSPAEIAALQQANLPVRLLRIPENRGFAEGNNLGAEAARGEHLLFLNNDAFLAPGALTELLAVFEANEDCGAVGPVFRYPSGLLQEAGAFIEYDGTASQRGKGLAFELRSLPKHDIVDYVSGACLLIKREMFRCVGGFHANYDVAYFEDVDLSLRLLRHGKLTIVARDALCFHIEGNTTGSSELRRSMALTTAANRLTFLGTWGPYLHSRLPADLADHQILQSSSQRPPVPHGGYAQTVLYMNDAFHAREVEGYILSLAGQLIGGSSAILAAPIRWSEIRLRNIEAWHELPPTLDASVAIETLSGQKARMVIAHGSAVVPQLPEAEQTIYVCHAPCIPIEERERASSGLERLAQLERIIVPSQFTKRALLNLASTHSVSLRADIEIVRPLIPALPPTEGDIGKRPWVLSMGAIGDPGRDGCHEEVVAAMAATSEGFRRDWKLIVCGTLGDPELAEQQIARMRKLAGDGNFDLQIVVSPPSRRRRELFERSAAFVDATGFGLSKIEDAWRCDAFGIGVMTALAAGCRTLAWEMGAGREIMDMMGAGQTFGSRSELTAQLDASSLQPTEAVSWREIARRFSHAPFEAAVRRN